MPTQWRFSDETMLVISRTLDNGGTESHLVSSYLPSGDILPPPAEIPLSKEDRIAALQYAYGTDIDRLNRAWLSALIADGVGEAARQAVIKGEMEQLDAQLEIDILAIIMEE